MSDFSRFDDVDPTETREWLESIDSVLGTRGPARAHFLLNQMIDFARRSGAYLPYAPNTAYLNTIATGRQPEYPAGVQTCTVTGIQRVPDCPATTGLQSNPVTLKDSEPF